MIGPDKTESDKNGHNLAGLNNFGQNWTYLERIEQEWTGFDSIGLDWIGLKRNKTENPFSLQDDEYKSHNEQNLCTRNLYKEPK